MLTPPQHDSGHDYERGLLLVRYCGYLCEQSACWTLYPTFTVLDCGLLRRPRSTQIRWVSFHLYIACETGRFDFKALIY